MWRASLVVVVAWLSMGSPPHMFLLKICRWGCRLVSIPLLEGTVKQVSERRLGFGSVLPNLSLRRDNVYLQCAVCGALVVIQNSEILNKRHSKRAR